MSETWEYELFISINFLQHEIYKERATRFEGESNKNLNEEFTVSVKDIICIIISDMILWITLRDQLFYCRSRQYTISKLFYRYHDWRRYDYPEGTKKITTLLDWRTVFIWYQGWHQEVIFMHCESIFMHRESIFMHRESIFMHRRR